MSKSFTNNLVNEYPSMNFRQIKSYWQRYVYQETEAEDGSYYFSNMKELLMS